MLLTIFTFLIILSVIVLVHELGHLITAKLSRVKVEEFGMGFPPKIFGFKRAETVYSLNAIPFGGFCKMLGEEDPTFPGSLASKSHATRLLVLSAGSIMNFLLAMLLYSVNFAVPHDVFIEKIFRTEYSILI